jgi:hypothetical protein
MTTVKLSRASTPDLDDLVEAAADAIYATYGQEDRGRSERIARAVIELVVVRVTESLPSETQGCRVRDEITQWTDEDGTLRVREGDLIVDCGELVTVDAISYTPGPHDRWVRVALRGRDRLFLPDEWVAVRRYIDTSED